MISVSKEFSKFRKNDFGFRKSIKEPLFMFSCWGIPGVFSIYAIKWLNNAGPAGYLQIAVSQGIGPILWNVMACFGVFFFGLSVVIPEARCLSIVASALLKNAYVMGCLTFGLLLGQFLILVPEIHSQIEVWRFWLFMPLSIYLLFAVFALNFAVWYLSHLIRYGSNFNLKLREIDWFVRLGAGFSIGVVITFLLWIEEGPRIIS